MAIFVVVPIGQFDGLETRARSYGNKSYKLPGGEFLVAFDGTSKQLSDELGLTDGGSGKGVIFSVNNYWGFAGKDVWEWLSVNGA